MMLTPKKANLSLKGYARFSSIAIQMGVIIFGGTFGGYKLDALINWKFPLFTVILSIASVGIAIFLVTKDLLKK